MLPAPHTIAARLAVSPASLRALLEPHSASAAFAPSFAAEWEAARKAIRIANASAAVHQAAMDGREIPAAAWDALAAARTESDAFRLVPADDVLSDPSTGGEVVLPGLIHRGDVAMLAAPSKAGKTWFLLGLANALARGYGFAGLEAPARQMRVAYVDGELEAWELRGRLQALAVSPGAALDFLLCRGRACRPVDVLPTLLSSTATRGAYDLIIFDPFYSFEVGRDENGAADMVSAMQELQRVAHDTGAAVLFAHHFSKGKKGSTDKADRASGSGVIVRAVNDCITLSPHSAGEGFYLCEAVTRSFGRFTPRVLSFRFPVWEVCPDMDATPAALDGAEIRRPGTAADVRQIAGELAAKIKNENALFTRQMVHAFAHERGADVEQARKVCDLFCTDPGLGIRWDKGRKVYGTTAAVTASQQAREL